MSTSPPAALGRHRAVPVWLLLTLPMIVAAAVRDLWSPDEPRYAEVAREVYETGSFLVLHQSGAPYADKPPLFFWLAGLCGWLTDWSELALRLPSLLATVATAWLVGRLARRWWDETAARWAPALYMGTALVTELGGRIQIDPLLTLLTTSALHLVSGHGRGGGSDTRVLAAGICTGLAALTKGPVAWVNVGLVLVVWRWLAPGTLPRVSVRSWTVAALLTVAPVVVWAGMAATAEPELAAGLLFEQHIGRVTAVGERHPGPPWKPLLTMPLGLLPWTPLLLAALPVAWRELRQARSGASADLGLVRAATWLIVLFLFYSAIPPKRDLYLLAAYPAAVLLEARFLALALTAGRLVPWIAVVPPAVLGLAGLGLCVAGVITSVLPGLAWRTPLVGLPLLVSAAAALVAWRRRRLCGWVNALLAGWCGFGVLTAALLFPPMDNLKSTRAFALEVAGRPERPQEIPCLIGVQPAPFRFYGRVQTVRAPSLLPALARDGADFLGLVSDRDWEQMDPVLKRRFRALLRRTVGGREIILLGASDTARPRLGSDDDGNQRVSGFSP